MGKTCEICGKEFMPKDKRYAKYCSRECNYKKVPWNKGLSKETDSRVRDNSDKIKSAFEEKGYTRNRPCVICGQRIRPTVQNSKYCSRTCMSIGQTGEGNPAWKGGKSFTRENCYHRRSYRCKRWRREILDNYENRCIRCGSEATHAHHIIPVAQNPCLRYNLDNGVAMCEICHRKEHSMETKGMVTS